MRSTYLSLDVCDGLMAKSPVGQVHETRQLPNSFKMIGMDGPMSIGQHRWWPNKFGTLRKRECQLTLLVWVFGSINMVLPLKLAPWLQGEALIRLDFLDTRSWGELRVSSELIFTRTQFTTKICSRISIPLGYKVSHFSLSLSACLAHEANRGEWQFFNLFEGM